MNLPGVSIEQAAQHFGVHAETVRRWIRAGAPCLSPGQPGRGHGARLDLLAVARWRGATGDVPDDVLLKVQGALLDVMRRDGGKGVPAHVEVGATREQAAAILTQAYARIQRMLSGGG
jgi:hypothetical protein